jgi:integrase
MWFNRFIREHTNKGRPLSQNTIKSYGVVLNSWKSFEKSTKRRVVLNELSENGTGRKVIQDYHRFLVSGQLNGSPCSDNSVRKYLKILSTFLRWCEETSGKTLIRKVSIQGEITSKHTISLTKEEVQRIEQVDLKVGSKLEVVRDMMLLGIYTGLRHSEWLKVRPELWKEPSQLITSQKTGKVCLVVHREQLRNVLKKYEQTGFRSSVSNIQKVNEQIKEVCKLSGLNRMVNKVKSVDGVEYHETIPLHDVVSTHTFRRTKITLELNSGRTLRDIVMETGQDEEIARKHYDRPNIDEFVKLLGIVHLE